MITIRFQSSAFDREIKVRIAPGERPTLLSIAAAHGVPILFNCRSGDCGACLVRVRTDTERPRTRAAMGDAERYRLQAMSLSADGDGEADDETSMEGEQARLACQFVLGEDDDGHEFVVTFASGLGNS